MSKLLSQLRKDNPRYSHYDDDEFIDLISSNAGIPRDDLMKRIGASGSPISTNPTSKIDQLRKDNPRYAHYDDEEWVSLVAEQTGSSLDDAAYMLGYQPPKPETKEGSESATALDYLKGAAAGSNKLVSGLGYLAEKAGAKETGKAIREFGDRGAAYWNESMTEGGKLAAKTQVFEDDDDPESLVPVKLSDKWGQALMMGASQSLPSMLAAALPGAAITKGIQSLAKLGLAGGAGATIPLLAGTAAPVTTGANIVARIPSAVGFGAAEGVTAGAMNAADFKTSIESMPFDELNKSPVFKVLTQEHGQEKARDLLAEQAASEVFGRTSLSTGAIGALTGGGALAQAYQKTAGLSKGGLLMQIAKGAGAEALQETPQSGGEAYIQNLATRNYLDPSKDVSEGVLSEALSGGAIGGFTGGIFGAGGSIQSKAQDRAAKINSERLRLGLNNIANAETVDEAINAAAETAAQRPVTQGDVFDDAMQREELLRRTEAFTQGAIDEETQQEAVTNPTQDAEVLTQPEGLGPQGQDIIDSLAGEVNPLTETEVTQAPDTGAPSALFNNRDAARRNVDIVLPDNTSLPAQWDVVDAATVQAAMQESENQPRDRKRAASEAQIAGISNSPNYALVSDSPVMDVGAPVLDRNNSIVAGNGRFEGLSRAYQSGTAKQYKERLMADAASKGIDPAIIANMERPILVRRVTQPFDTRKVAIKSNSGLGLQYSALELAKIDSERMKGLGDIEVSDNGDIALTQQNMRNIRDAFGDYDAAELGSLIGKDGALSQDGMRRVKSAILYSAYGNSATLNRMIESTDNDMRNIVGTLTKVAGNVVKVKQDIKAGAIPAELDITNDLIDATEKIAQLKAQNMPIDAYLAQDSMFGDISDESKEVMRFLSDNMRSQKKMAEFIRSVYDGLGSIDTTTADIFGDTALPTKSEVIQNAKRQAAGQAEQQASIFDEPNVESSTKTRQEPESKGGDVASGKESAKYSRSAEERLKDDDRARRLEKNLRSSGFGFRIKPADVRDFAPMDRSRQNEAVAAEQIAKIFGKRITWIEANGDFRINGVVVPSISDTIFIDVSTDRLAHAVMGHELSHHMEYNAPKAYADMVAALTEIIPNTKKYAEQYGISGADDAYIIKEIVGDIMGDNFTQPEFWNKVAAYNPNAFRKIADTIVSWIKKFVTNAKMRGLGSEKWVTDATKAQDIVAKAVAQHTPNLSAPAFGKKISGSIKPDTEALSGVSGNSGDFDAIQSSLEVADKFIKSNSAFFLRGKVSPSEKDKPDSVIADSEVLANISESAPIIKHGFGGLDIPSKRVMFGAMSRMLKNSEVRNLVIESVPIDVMNMLTGGKIPPDVLFHDMPMLFNLLSINGDKAISASRNATSETASVIASMGAKAAILKVAASPNKLSPALLTRKGNSFSPALHRAVKNFGGFESFIADAKDFSAVSASNLGHNYRKFVEYNGDYNTIFDDKDVEIKAKFSKKGGEEDYRGEHRAPSRDGGAPLSDLTGEGNIYPDDVYSNMAAQYYGDGSKLDKITFDKAKLFRGKPNATVEIYRAVPKDAPDEINAGDWVSINKAYVKDHGSRYLDDFKIISKKVKAGEIFTNGDSIHEWGYDPESSALFSRAKANTGKNEPLFPESNRLSNINKSGQVWQTILRENPALKIASDTVTVYRATVGGDLRFNDYVALNKDVAEQHLENLADRGEEGKIIKQKVSINDLLMANDATEFIYAPIDSAKKDERLTPASKRESSKKADSMPDTINIDGKDRPTMNSNGQLIAQNEEGIRNFYKWFGESRVADDQGRPLVVYHGTSADVGTFERGKSSSTRGSDKLDLFYFTPSKSAASLYASNSAKRQGGDNVIPAYLKLENPLIITNQDDVKDDGNGFVRYYDDSSEIAEVAVKSSNQIKSAVGNSGEFSSERDDIRFSRAATKSAQHGDDKQYHRFTNGDINNDVDYLMFSENIDDVNNNYGSKHYTVNTKDIPKNDVVYAGSNVFKNQVIEALSKKQELLDEYQATAEQLADELNPDRIVNSAGLWDNAELVEVIYNDIIEPNKLRAVETNDGIILFDKSLASSVNNETSFSRASTLANAGVNTAPQSSTQAASALPEESKLQSLRRKTQDAMLRFKVLQNWLTEQGVNLTEAANVYQRENISKGKTANKIEDFRNKELEPLIKDIAKAKFELGDVVTYLEAKHIPEANARMRMIHGDPNATANGITDKQARQVLADFQAMPNFMEFEKLANRLGSIGRDTLDLRLQAGIVSQERYDNYTGAYQHWVPLRGNMSKQGFGKGLSVSAKDKRRFGHDFREDELILENMIQDRERAIIQIEKNKVALSVLEFLMQANNPEIGTVGQPQKQSTIRDYSYAVEYKGRVVGSFENKGAADAAIVRIMNGQGTLPISGQVHASDLKVVKTYDPHVIMMAKPMLAENEIQAYVNGSTVRMQLNDTLLAHAATNAGIEQVGSIVEAARGFNRFLSKAYTAYSPDFVFMNMMRDMYSGTLVLTGKKGAQFAAKTFANYGTAIRELIKGRKDPTKSQWVTRYRAAGGNIGAAYLSDLERVGEDALLALQTFAGARETYRMVYDDQIAQGASKTKAATMASMRAGRAKARSIPVLGSIFKIIERVNMIVENALRLATFKTAIEAGESDQQAAMLSKDLMNFNRKGEMASQLSAAYLFFNPGMQGAHIVGEALFTSPHKKQVWAMLGALTALSFLLSEIGRGGDDDDEREWQNIPDHVKNRNLVLKFGDTQVTIPVAYGFGVFHSIGGALSDIVHGEDIQKVAIKMASSLFENFSVFGNPIEAGDEKTNINPYHVLPTALKIGTGPGANIDGLGRQIHPESYSDAQPDSTLMTRSVRGTIYEDIASFLNDNTGGSKYNPGAIDISPNTIKYWVTSLFGGAGRFVSDVVTGSMDAASGVAPDLGNTPVIRKFVRESGVVDSRGAFWKAAKEAQAAATRFNKSKADGDIYTAQKMLDENSDIIALAEYSRKSAAMAAKARDDILTIQKDESLSRVEKKVRIKEIEKIERDVYDTFLSDFDIAKKDSKR